jgi:hypothetical protein
MDIKKLARELSDLRFESGYIFENGTPFFEILGLRRAEGLLNAFRDRGYIVSPITVDSPSLCESIQSEPGRP